MVNILSVEKPAETKLEDLAPSGGTRDCLNSVAEAVCGQLPDRPTGDAVAFVQAFYAALPLESLTAAGDETLTAMALAQWRFVQERAPGALKLRIFNPTQEIDGWQSSHTVVAMLKDDMPFIIDSTAAYLAAQQLTIHRLIHPVLEIGRDGAGMLTDVQSATGHGSAHLESCVLIEIDRCASETALMELERGLIDVLGDVRAVVAGWKSMLARLADTVALLGQNPPPGVPEAESEEAIAFLKWMSENHFTLLGYREYDIANVAEGDFRYQVSPDSGIGVLRDPAVRPLGAWSDKLPPEALEFYASPNLLMITKSAERSRVHRPVAMDSIGVKIYDAKGRVSGERRFMGLFTSTAYSRSVNHIPVLRRKVRHVLEQSKFTAGGHNQKALEHVLESRAMNCFKSVRKTCLP